MEKLYTLFSDADHYGYSGVSDGNHYAYSGFLTQAVESPKGLRPIVYNSDSFSYMQQRWSANEKEDIAVFQSVSKFDLYLKGAKCILHWNYKPLEPFLSKCIKILKHNRWSMELAYYNIMFVHIKAKTMFWQTLSPG